MKFSVVIPSYNRQTALQQTLDALCQQTHPDYEIIVVDDGSTDGTDEMIATHFPSVHYFRQTNRGPAAARNVGIRAASGDVVAFTDDDCVPPVDWLARLADGYARYPDVVGVGGYLQAPDDILRTNVIARYERSVGRDVYGAGATEKVGAFDCPAGGTNNMSYRRTALLTIGGFDESFPYAAGEDADIKFRLCNQGGRLLYVPVKVVHVQEYSWPRFRRQQITLGRGVVHYERKHLGRPPSRFRLLLRAGKRVLIVVPDFIVGPDRAVALVRFTARWYDALGQWYEVQRITHAVQSSDRP